MMERGGARQSRRLSVHTTVPCLPPASLQRLRPDADPGHTSAAAVAAEIASAAAPLSLLPTFRQPKVTRALLPGSLHYLHARLPAFELGGTGRELVTHVAGHGTAMPQRHTCVPCLSAAAGTILRAFLPLARPAHRRLVLDRFGRVAELEVS